jgi:hypothetical protein
MTDIPEAALKARQMYADGETVLAIKAETGLTHHALYRWLDGGPHGALPPLTKRRHVKKARITPGDCISVVSRIMRSAERQIADIEKRIGTPDDRGERDTRTLALLARTIRELMAMDKNLDPGTATKADDEHDPPPDDIDEFRNELTRRIHSFIAGGKTG